MDTVRLATLKFLRAGSDYVPGVWTANVTGFPFVLGNDYRIERNDGTGYVVRATRLEPMAGETTTLLVSPD